MTLIDGMKAEIIATPSEPEGRYLNSGVNSCISLLTAFKAELMSDEFVEELKREFGKVGLIHDRVIIAKAAIQLVLRRIGE